MKHFLVLMVLCGGIIAIIAYHVGASNNYLSTTQTTFSDLSSSNHANQLKATMRDAMINKLSHWAQNHETRLQVHAQSSNYPNLTNDQLSFSSFLSSKNNNMLTAQMWDGLVGKFTTVLTNHEMRLRCIQDGSCLDKSKLCGTGTSTPSQPSLTEQYNCVGEWSIPLQGYCGQDTDKTDALVGRWVDLTQACNDIVTGPRSFGNICNIPTWIIGGRWEPRDGTSKWHFLSNDPNYCEGSKNSADCRHAKWGLRKDEYSSTLISCRREKVGGGYYCPDVTLCDSSSQRACNPKFCQRHKGAEIRCDHFNESACKHQRGCSRVRK